MAFRLAEARILLALPYQDQYLVAVEGLGGPVTAVDTSGSSSASGVRGGRVWRPGDRALAAVSSVDSQRSRSLIYLLSAYPVPFPAGEDTEFFPVSLRDESDTGQFGNPMYRVVHAQSRFPILFQDRSYGRPLDINPGDWYQQNVFNGVVLLSDFLRRCGVSPRSYEDDYSADELVRRVFHDMQSESPTSSDTRIHRGNRSLRIEEEAFSVAEGLGGLRLPPFIREEDFGLIQHSADQAGFFRSRSLSGGMVGGLWRTISAPPQDNEIYRFADSGELGLFSEEVTGEGEYRLKASGGIRLERTGSIPVPVRVHEPFNVDFDPAAESGVPSEQSVAQAFGLRSSEEYLAVRDILRDSDLQEYELRYENLRKDSGLWLLPSADEVKKTAFGTADPPKLPPITAQQREYSDVDLETLLGEIREIAPGKRVRLMKSSSAFVMTEDGGIVIGDGFGGEIRMHRGTVSITSAGDTIIDSGRDFIQQTGGQHLVKARKRVEISSSNKSVLIKAEGSLHLTSGNGGEGALVLENNARRSSLNDSDIRRARAGDAVGSGVVIRSKTNPVGIYANALYAGPNILRTSEDPSRTGLPSESGGMNIWLNADGGDLLASAGTANVQGRTSASIGIEDSPTGLYLTSSQASLAASSVSVLASALFTGVGRGTVNKPYMTGTGVETRSISMPGGSHQVNMSGGLNVRDGVRSKGPIASEAAVTANQGCNPDPLSGLSRVTVAVENSPNQTPVISRIAESAKSVMQSAIDSGRATEFGQKVIQAAFPDSESNVYRAQAFKYTGHTWQGMLDGGSRWVENKLNHDILGYTMPFPGRGVYDANLPVLTIPAPGGVREVSYKEYPVNDTE